MIRALLIDIAELLRTQGDNFAKDVQEAVPVAEGKLKESVKSDVIANGAVITLTIEAAPYFRNIELGRRPAQRPPPPSAIRRWCEVKGIYVRAAFPIARAIGKRGITGKHIIPTVIARRQPHMEALITRAFGEAVKVDAENMVKRIFEKKAA